MDEQRLALKGIYRDVLRSRDGLILSDSGWRSNTIVDGFRVLLAGFIKNEAPPSPVGAPAGIRSLAIGQGDPAWDTQRPAAAPVSTSALVRPYDQQISVDSLKLAYLNTIGEEVAEPTSRLQISATLGEGFPAPPAGLSYAPLREFGLFAAFGGRSMMLNCIRHPLLNKDVTTTLIRVIRLTF
jgi:hypothetical protein